MRMRCSAGLQLHIFISRPPLCRLQDVHWSSGAFGYFPTYSLGMRNLPTLPQPHFVADATLLMSAVFVGIPTVRCATRHRWHACSMRRSRICLRCAPGCALASRRRAAHASRVRHAGAMYACQIYRAAEKDLPSLAEDVAAGRFAPLRGWLREKIHKVRSARALAPFLPSSRRPNALLACACGIAPS